GPCRSDREAGVNEGCEQRLPRLLLLVSEHYGEDAIVLKHAMALAERASHQITVVSPGFCTCCLHALVSVAKPADVDDCFLIVVAQVGRKPVGMEVTLRAFEPDVEEIGQFAVLNVIVIGGINYDGSN